MNINDKKTVEKLTDELKNTNEELYNIKKELEKLKDLFKMFIDIYLERK